MRSIIKQLQKGNSIRVFLFFLSCQPEINSFINNRIVGIYLAHLFRKPTTSRHKYKIFNFALSASTSQLILAHCTPATMSQTLCLQAWTDDLWLHWVNLSFYRKSSAKGRGLSGHCIDPCCKSRLEIYNWPQWADRLSSGQYFLIAVAYYSAVKWKKILKKSSHIITMFLVADTFNQELESGSLRGALPLSVIQVQLRQPVRTVISMTRCSWSAPLTTPSPVSRLQGNRRAHSEIT